MRTDLIVAGGLAALVLGLVAASRRTRSAGPNLVQPGVNPSTGADGYRTATLQRNARYRGRVQLPAVVPDTVNPWTARLKRATTSVSRWDLSSALTDVAVGPTDQSLGFRDVVAFMNADEARASGMFPPDAFADVTVGSRWFEGVWAPETTRITTSPIVAIWAA